MGISELIATLASISLAIRLSRSSACRLRSSAFVWGHHLFTSGQSPMVSIIFSFLTFSVNDPTAIKVFNWMATMAKGSISRHADLYARSSFSVRHRWLHRPGKLARIDRHPYARHLFRGALPHVMMGVPSRLLADCPTGNENVRQDIVRGRQEPLLCSSVQLTFFSRTVMGSKACRGVITTTCRSSLCTIGLDGAFTLAGLFTAAGNLPHALAGAARRQPGARRSNGSRPPPPPYDTLVGTPESWTDVLVYNKDAEVDGFVRRERAHADATTPAHALVPSAS